MGTGDGGNSRLIRTPRPTKAVAPWERVAGKAAGKPVSPQPARDATPDDGSCDETGAAVAGAVTGRRRWRRLVAVGVRCAVALTAVVALALTGCAWQWNSSKNGSLNTVAALDPTSPDIVRPAAQLGDDNFLIAGIDSRAGANGEIGAGTSADVGGARSDTVMLVHVPADRKRVVVVSFPRDLAITPIQCNSWDNDTASYGSETVGTETKLNSAYAVGGPKCLVKVIQKLSGLRVNRFVALDFVGFSRVVDEVGGVEVCSTTPLQDYELGTVLDHAGPQTLDGRSALNYVRARKVTTDGTGDYGRIKRQQLFLSSLLRSLISRDVFFSVNRLNDVVNTFIASSYVDNVTAKDLIDLARSVQGVAAGRVTFLTVPTAGTDAEGNEEMSVDGTHAIFDAIINDYPLPQENNSNGAATPTAGTRVPGTQPDSELVDAVTTQPAAVTVQVSNATSETGLAASAADQLQQQGFNVLSPDNYPDSLPATTVLFSAGNEGAAATVAGSLANPQIERVAGMGQTVQLVLGPDFNAVGAAPPSGSAVRVHVNQDLKVGSNADPATASVTAPPRLPDDLTVTNGADTSCK